MESILITLNESRITVESFFFKRDRKIVFNWSDRLGDFDSQEKSRT